MDWRFGTKYDKINEDKQRRTAPSVQRIANFRSAHIELFGSLYGYLAMILISQTCKHWYFPKSFLSQIILTYSLSGTWCYIQTSYLTSIIRRPVVKWTQYCDHIFYLPADCLPSSDEWDRIVRWLHLYRILDVADIKRSCCAAAQTRHSSRVNHTWEVWNVLFWIQFSCSRLYSFNLIMRQVIR